MNRQFQEKNRRQDETDTRVECNTRQIRATEKDVEELRQELRRLNERMDEDREAKEDTLCEELRERDVRRCNVIIHGVPEPDDSIQDNRERMEIHKIRCEELFQEIRARTRKPDIRFCQRIGERGRDSRPIVIGVTTEEEKKHLLDRAKELQRSRFNNVAIVPDLTKLQRRGEEKLVREAEERNKSLTREDMDKNQRWLVVGKRGEKRMIKGVEREPQGDKA